MEAHLWILDFDKDFSTPELVAIGAGTRYETIVSILTLP